MAPTQTSTPHRLDIGIGRRIRDRRRAIGMSQQRLAEAAGVTFQQIQKYERGANRVSFSRLVQIAQALGCSVSELAEGLDAPHSGESRRLETLLEMEGATELLEAYAGIPTREIRRALLEHAQALAEVRQGEPMSFS